MTVPSDSSRSSAEPISSCGTSSSSSESGINSSVGKPPRGERLPAYPVIGCLRSPGKRAGSCCPYLSLNLLVDPNDAVVGGPVGGSHEPLHLFVHCDWEGVIDDRRVMGLFLFSLRRITDRLIANGRSVAEFALIRKSSNTVSV